MRRELGRRLEQAGEHRAFGQIHVTSRLVEIILSRGIHAEGAAAHIGAVEIQFQNLVLGQARLQPHGQERLLDLAVERALVRQKQVLGELLRQRRAALHDAAGLRIGDDRAQGAADVDAEMLVEAPVLGRQHSLDQVVRKLVEGNRIVVPYAARADLVAVAVQKCDGQLGLLQPVVVGGHLEGRRRQSQQQHAAGGAQRGALRGQFDQAAPPAGGVEAVHEGGKALIALAQADAGAEHAEIDPGVDGQHRALDFGLPILGKQVAQGGFALKSGCIGTLSEGLAPRARRNVAYPGRISHNWTAVPAGYQARR